MLKKRMLRICAVMLGTMLVVTGTVSGKEIAQALDKTKTQDIESMVVTSGRIKEKKEDVTTNITVYTQEDLETLSVSDLSDLMVKEGFMLREYPNSTISVGIRGFRTETHGNDLSSHVLILIDGRRAGTGNLAKISMDNVERIEIIRGPGSVQYGASAMGGVVNVITKKGKEGFTASTEGTLGSWEYKKAKADLSGKVSRFDYSASVSKSTQGDYDTANGTRYYNTGYDSKENIDLNSGFTLWDKNRVGVSFSQYTGDGIGSPDYLSSNNRVKYVDHGLKSYDVYYNGQTQDGFLLWNARYFKGEDEYETYDPTKAEPRTYFRDTDNQGVQAQITAQWDIFHVTGGIDWTDYAISNTNTLAGKENTYENPAAFLMAKAKLFDKKLVLSAGGRYDEYEVTSDAGKVKEETNWSMSFGAVYKLLTGLSVRANFAQAFRMPTAEEMFMYNDYTSWGMGYWMGNEDLKPETSQTYEAGIDYVMGTLTAGLTYFYTDFEDKIAYEVVSAPGVSPTTTQYRNIAGATLSGVEGSLQFDIGEWFDWEFEVIPYASFTLHTKYEDDSNGENLQYVPEKSASYGLRFNNAALGFFSRLNFTHFGEHDITDYVGNGAKSLGGDTIADFSLTKRLFSFEKYGKVSLKGEINNLFDTDYALVQGYPSPGRTFYLGVNYTY